MHNVWLIFRQDVSNLLRNVMSVIITIGLVILPSMFAWYNILACWNVFENTGNLSIAVANDDEGYTSDLVPIEVNVGDKVVSALRANDQINWVITDSEDAIEGAKSGKYYASLVIPEDFSQQMLTFYTGDSQSATIFYYVDEKKNAISPNITNAGADTVSYEVNEVFADTISEIIVGLAKGLSQEADNANIVSANADLTSHMRAVSERINQTADVLSLYSSLGQESQSLLKSTVNLVQNAQSKAESALSSVSGDRQALLDFVAKLETAINELSGLLEQNKTAMADLESKLDSLLSGATADLSAAATQIRGAASNIDALASDLSDQKAVLEQLRDELQSGAATERDAMIENGSTETEIRAYIEVTVERTAVLDEAISVLSKVIDTLQQASSNLTSAADDLESGGADVQSKIEALRQTINQVKTDITTVANDFENNLKPSVDQLKADLQKLIADFDGVTSGLASMSTDVSGLTNEVDSALGEIVSKINDACAKLRTAAQDMSALADSIDAALASGDIETLRSLLENDVSDIAAALSAPVQIDRNALYPVDNFGSAMAPLYCALAMFIGSLLIMVATKPEVSKRGREALSDPKPRHLYFGRFGVVGLLSLLQTTVLGLGNMLFLKVQVTEPLLYMVCFWVSGLVFVFIIYTLVVSFGNLGKAIAVLLLIVQVTACGGSYPLQILPGFVQTISPFVPATHVVNALRAAMFGVYQNDFWISMGCLVLFVVPFLLLGLVLRGPLVKVVGRFVERVEASKLM